MTSKAGWKWSDILYDLGMRFCDPAHQDCIIKFEKVDDICRTHNAVKIVLIPAPEGAAMIENELDRIEILYGFRVQVMGITYSESNCLSTGLREPRDAGLTGYGCQAVEAMNKIGMAIDCANCGDQMMLDTIAASNKPIFLTYTGAHSLGNLRRLLPDKALNACADKGGVIGIEAAPHTTLTKNHPQHSIGSCMEHFEYIKDLVGLDHVTCGARYLPRGHIGRHRVFAWGLPEWRVAQKSALSGRL